MSTMDEAINYVLKNETFKEHYSSNDKDDHGGFTRFGISTDFYLSLPDDEPLKNKPLNEWNIEDARVVYKKYIWNKSSCDKIKNPILAIKLFDTIVNIGDKRASQILQKSVNHCMGDEDKLIEDGTLGVKSLKQINFMHPIALLKIFCNELLHYYHKIVERDPTQRKFINGWTARAVKLPREKNNP